MNYNDLTRPNSPQMAVYVGNRPPTTLFQVGELPGPAHGEKRKRGKEEKRKRGKEKKRKRGKEVGEIR